MCRHRQRCGGARESCGSRALIVCVAPVSGDGSSASACIRPSCLSTCLREGCGEDCIRAGWTIGSVQGVNCDASQNPHRAWRRGQESGGARRCGALSVGRVPRRVLPFWEEAPPKSSRALGWGCWGCWACGRVRAGGCGADPRGTNTVPHVFRNPLVMVFCSSVDRACDRGCGAGEGSAGARLGASSLGVRRDALSATWVARWGAWVPWVVGIVAVGRLRAPGSRVHVSVGVAGALVRTPHDAGSELIPTLVRRALATVQRTGSTKTHTQAREEQPGVRSYGRGNAGRVQVCEGLEGRRGLCA